MTPIEAGARLDAASAMVANLRAELGRGSQADLSPLLDVVETACNAIATLPKDAARELLPRIVALMDEIDRLERMLDEARAAAKSELDGLAKHSRANAAYRGGPRGR